LCVNNDDNSSDEADCESTNGYEINYFILMAIDNPDNEDTRSELNDEKDEVDLEGKIVSELEEIDRLRLKKRKQKKLLINYVKNCCELSEAFISLRVEL